MGTCPTSSVVVRRVLADNARRGINLRCSKSASHDFIFIRFPTFSPKNSLSDGLSVPNLITQKVFDPKKFETF